MNFKPLSDNVLVKVSPAEKKTESGIIVPINSQEKPNTGEVISVGSGTLVKDGVKFPIEVEVGSRVLFRRDVGVPLDIDGEDYLVLREYDILGII